MHMGNVQLARHIELASKRESMRACMVGVDRDGRMLQCGTWGGGRKTRVRPESVCLYVPQETCLVCQTAALFSSCDAKIEIDQA